LEICNEGIKNIKNSYGDRQKRLSPEESSPLNED